MTSGRASARAWIDGALTSWGQILPRRATSVVAVSLALGGGALTYAVGHLGINTDTAGMLSDELPFRRNHAVYKDAFPLNRPGLLVVVDAGTPEGAHGAMADLEEALEADTQHVSWLHRADGLPFFREHALLYRDSSSLRSAVRTLEGGLGEVLRSSDLIGLLGYAAQSGPGAIRTEVLRSVGATLQDQEYELSWARALTGAGPDPEDVRLTLQVEPHRDNTRLFPTGAAQERIAKVARQVERAHAPHVSIRITGPDALEHEELVSVARGGALAGVAAFLLVILVLGVGLGSTSLVAATAVTLVVGLAITAGFAALAVGRLNMISIAFAVLYIGLGVDYAIHLALRYREILSEGIAKAPAVQTAVREVGPSLGLCALTTSIGFYAFVPTAFSGVAELGLISGTGMFVGLLASLTLLPALLLLLPTPRVGAGDGAMGPGRPHWMDLPFRHPGRVRAVAWIAAALSLALVFQARFDHNPNNLRDPSSESVSTFRDLLEAEGNAPWTLTWLAGSAADARARAGELETLATVERVASVMSFLPQNQEVRLGHLARIAELAGPERDGRALVVSPPGPTRLSRQEALLGILPILDLLAASHASTLTRTASMSVTGDADDDPLQRLVRGLGTRLALASDAEAAALLRRLHDSAFKGAVELASRARELVREGPRTVDDLPWAVRERWISPGGVYRVEVVPSRNLGDEEAMRAFVDDVRQVVPDATGLPVVYLEAAAAVVSAFQQAFAGALVAISLLLVLLLHRIRDTLYVLMPLLLAGLATGALAVVSGISFNFANIIVLPLLFGLGVDNGIHLVQRIHRLAPVRRSVLATSTARGVVFSGLTTLFSFSSLAFTSHRGIASMGQLLVLGVILILVTTLVVLPAFITEANPLHGGTAG